MHITRREFFKHSALSVACGALLKHRRLLAYAQKKGIKLKIGATDWNLRQEAKIESIPLAKRIGFDGVQISLGVGTDKLPLSDPAVQQAFLALGHERICEVHLKDNPHYLGQGKIDFMAVIDALADISFDRWAQLECDSPTGLVENDLAVNLKYIRGVIARQNNTRN